MAKPEYADPAWKKIRLLILERDGHRCQIGLSKCKGHATDVDHIIAIADGGPRLDPSNLRASCRSCNVSKRNTDVARRAKRLPVQPVGRPVEPGGRPCGHGDALNLFHAGPGIGCGQTWPR